MSRSVSTPDSADESFSGLLDRLTRRAGRVRPDSAPEAETDAATGQKNDAGLSDLTAAASRSSAGGGPSRRAFARPLRPVAESNPGKGKRASEGAELSYEKALQRHSRRKAEAELDASLDAILLADAVTLGTTSDPPPAPATENRRNQPPDVAKAQSNAQAPVKAAKPAGSATLSPPSSVRDAARREIRTRSQTAGRTSSDATESTPSPPGMNLPQVPAHARRRKARMARNSRTGVDSPGISEPPQSKIRMPARTGPLLEPGSRQLRDDGRHKERDSGREKGREKEQGRNIAQDKAPDSAKARFPGRVTGVGTEQPPGRIPAFSPSLPPGLGPSPSPGLKSSPDRSLIRTPEQRREIISVRLSEVESVQLRQRAAESGISVSAYMRSCVLDAEHLRAQVKHALAEMRAATRQPEQIQLPPISGQRHGGSWIQVITKTAALFLGPIFSMRHRV